MNNLPQNQTIENRREFLTRTLAGAAVITAAVAQSATALPAVGEPVPNPEVRGDVDIVTIEFGTTPGIQCIIGDRKLIFVNRDLSPQERERFIEEALHSFRTSDVWKRSSSVA